MFSENVFFEGAILKSLMKNNFLFNRSFFNKSLLTVVCNPYFEKESLKIRKGTKKTSNFIQFPK